MPFLDTFSLKGKVALVTGGATRSSNSASGFGRRRRIAFVGTVGWSRNRAARNKGVRTHCFGVSGRVDCRNATTPRADEAGGLYHALNRGNARGTIFHKDEDFAAFERIMAEALERYAVELFAYQWMPNHWHLVLRPQRNGETSRYLRWVTATHTMRYHAHYHTSGEGHVYQGRFKSFPIQDDGHFLTVCRYVERNALRAGLVKRAEDWRWGSLWRWLQRPEPEPRLLSPCPIPRWPRWVESSVNRLGLQSTRPLDSATTGTTRPRR